MRWVLSLMLVSSLAAATVRVEAEGKDSGDGSAGQPWASVGALDNSNPGCLGRPLVFPPTLRQWPASPAGAHTQRGLFPNGRSAGGPVAHHAAVQGRLRFLAPEGVNPNRDVVVAPRLRELVRIEGDATNGRPVSGLTFSDADYETPTDGMISPQSAVPMRGGFRATHAVDCRVEECTLANFAGYGLDLGRGTQRWKFVGNTVRDLGAGGIRIGEPGDRQPSAFGYCRPVAGGPGAAGTGAEEGFARFRPWLPPD